MIRAGVDLVSIQHQLGHEDITITAVYLKYAGQDEAKVFRAFEKGHACIEQRECPFCGGSWQVDTRTGALMLDDRLKAELGRVRGRVFG